MLKQSEGGAVESSALVARSEREPARARNWSLALLFMAAALNQFDRQIINILAQSIKADLRLSDAELGLLTGTAFGIFYAAFGIPLGWLADRFDRIKLIAGYLLVWSGFTALCGAAGGFSALFACRVGVGVGEAGAQPASTSLIPDFFGEERRVSAMSVLLVSGPVGHFLGLIGGGYLGASWGWRTAFVVASAPGAVLALIMMTCLRDPRRPVPATADHPAQPSLRAALAALAARPRFYGLTLALLCSCMLVYGGGAWLPSFFIRHHGMPMREVGAVAALTVGLGGGIGTLGAGLLCDWLRPRTKHLEAKLLIAAFAMSLPLLLVTVFASDKSTALAGWFGFNVVAFAYQGPTISLIQDAAGPKYRAIALAVASTVAVILSLGVGIPLMGLISDRIAPYYGSASIGYALAAGVAVAAVVGAFAHWLARARA